MADRRRWPAVAAACLMLVGSVAVGSVAAPAGAAESAFDVNGRAGTWDEAAGRLGTAGSLWEPAVTLGLDRARSVRVIAEGLSFEAGAVTGGDTYAGTRYGTAKRGFWLDEKWADTGWAAEPVVTTSRAKVGSVRLRLGPRGVTTTVVATVWADCFEQPADEDPTPVPRRFRCTRADVLRTGGTLTMTARPASQMTAPGNTSIVIRSTGLTYGELLAVARSVEQVAGMPVAGSAQMVAMCRQMVTGTMTLDQASAFAQANGYSVRMGSVDGLSLPVTSDYRPDRFTVATVGGVVTSCTYG